MFFELKSKLSEHLDRVESGEQLVVTRNGKPIAKLVSFEQSRRPLGAFANALIWAPSAPKKFGRQFIRRFEGAGWAYYSPLSVFELQLLSRIHRGPQVSKDITKMLNEIGLVELSYSSDAALAASDFSHLADTDPFDSMLISQASAAGVDFYTSDRRLLSLGLRFVKDSTV